MVCPLCLALSPYVPMAPPMCPSHVPSCILYVSLCIPLFPQSPFLSHSYVPSPFPCPLLCTQMLYSYVLPMSLAMFPHIHHVFFCIYPYVSLCLHVLSFIPPCIPDLFSISIPMCLLYVPFHIPSYVPLCSHILSPCVPPMLSPSPHVPPNSFLCPFSFPSYVSSYMSPIYPPRSAPMSYILIG